MCHFYKTPAFLKALSPSLIWDIPTSAREVYITFDDGPIPELTPYVLKTLDDFHAKATFFCVGDNIRKHPEVFLQIKERQHSIGNHTYNHLKAWNCTSDTYFQNILLCDEVIGEPGKDRQLFRPPHGQITPGIIRRLKKTHKIIMWDILAYDFSPSHSAESSLRQMLQKTRPGSIVVFHDNYKAENKLKYMLPRFLEYFSGQGYVFKNLHDMSSQSLD